MKQVSVGMLVSGVLQHPRRYVHACDVGEAELLEVLANKACSTAEVQDAARVRVEATSLGMLGNHLGDFQRIGISETKIRAFVVTGDMIEVGGGLAKCVTIALLDLFDVLGRQVLDVPVEFGRLGGILVEAYGGVGDGRADSHITGDDFACLFVNCLLHD